MTGGRIKRVYKLQDRMSVWVLDGKDELAIDIEPNDCPLRPGDGIWWQDRYAYWTPVSRTILDVAIHRIGYTYTVSELYDRLRRMSVAV